jgi:hypothetical protein
VRTGARVDSKAPRCDASGRFKAQVPPKQLLGRVKTIKAIGVKLMRYLPLLIIFELSVSTAAFATVSPCTGDRLKFCKDVKAAPEDVLACLLQHKDELSDACKARLGESSKAKA